MLFNSWTFFGFIIVFYPIYYVVHSKVVWRNIVLLLGSYLFYGWWDSRFLILVAVSTAVDYCAALGASGKPVLWNDRLKSIGFMIATTVAALAVIRSDAWILSVVAAGIVAFIVLGELIERAPAAQRRAFWLAMSLSVNLGILLFFKYFNFFIDSAIGAAALFSLTLDFPTLKILLPVGLSFYTFQAISRTVDSYRGSFDPQRSLLNYAAYHAFFPQLVAGPIERASHFMPQFEGARAITQQMVSSGVLLFLWGMFKKVVIADNMAPIADTVFGSGAGNYTSAEAVVAVIAFTFQIYGDFSGYSDMARGLARTLGFDLMNNFNLPYFSRSPQEFWRRWHISLSRWLRDYLYIPLGGNRRGHLAMYRNLMLTMILGGLWHGAAWTFVIWGAFHGAIQVAYSALGIDKVLTRVSSHHPAGFAVHLAAWAVTMVLVMIGWVFFRAPTIGSAVTIIHRCLGLDGYSYALLQPLLFYILPLIIVELYQRASGNIEFMTSGPRIVRFHMVMMVTLAVVVLGASGGQQFIYFDF